MILIKKKKLFVLCSRVCVNNDTCDLNTDLLPANTSVVMECAIGVHVTRNSGYINGPSLNSDV